MSEEEPDVSITMNYPINGYGYGKMNYKNEPAYFFEVGGFIAAATIKFDSE